MDVLPAAAANAMTDAELMASVIAGLAPCQVHDPEE